MELVKEEQFLALSIHVTDKSVRQFGLIVDSPRNVLELVAQKMGEDLHRDVDFLMLAGGQCLECSHLPYKRATWFRKHMRNKHAG